VAETSTAPMPLVSRVKLSKSVLSREISVITRYQGSVMNPSRSANGCVGGGIEIAVI
jgi:hypothetical protein